MRIIRLAAIFVVLVCTIPPTGAQSKYVGSDGRLRVALAKQPLSPTGPSKGPTTMAEGGIQKILSDLGATVRVDEAKPTADEETEYGGWKKLGMSLGRANQKQNACVVLAQLDHDFPTPGAAIKERATTEKKKLGC